MIPTWRSIQKTPRVYTIPADAPFVDSLAAGVLADTAGDPLALPAITILLPTRRACRSLREAFLRLSGGKPLLLPRLVPLNDMDEEETLFSSFAAADAVAEIPPPISALKRQLMLARFIRSLSAEMPIEQCVLLAQELARFLDQVQTERLTFDALKNLAPERFALHWQETLRFLGIVTTSWPEILREENALDPAEHRNRLFAAQSAAWKTNPPGPVIAAGSTGSIPATADLLATIAALPEGCVVLPGLDSDLDHESWQAVDETHPQHGLKELLAHIGIAREDVNLWPGSDAPQRRTRFLSEVMRPAATTDRWQEISGFNETALAGLTRLECASPREEAEAVALIMRETLEHPTRTCALVTPDRDLAERVAAELARWAIDIDDSAGKPLAQTPPGVFLRLTAAMVAGDFAPVATLAACKHPFAAASHDPADFRALTRDAEREILRGVRPPPGLDGLHHAAQGKPSELWVALLARCCKDFAALMRVRAVPLSKLLAAHMDAAEALAASADTHGALRLWAEDAGETAARFIADLGQHADTLPPISPAAYPALLEALMEGVVVRPRFGRHPRLHILGPLEARLQRFDVFILSGLNEGTWPNESRPDPWMSRPMRKDFGLPSPERRIGQAAHDVVQTLCAPRVVLTRARKVEGTPTVPSRWLMRLDRVCEAAGLAKSSAGDWRAWAKDLTHPAAFATALPPSFKPPLAARPRRLSVTAIERWMRDPYSIYAQYILKLRPLDPLEQEVSVAEYGTLIHGALQDFIREYPSGPLPRDAFGRLQEFGRARFDVIAARPGVMAFWGPRFERVAAWFIDVESARRVTLTKSYAEVKGEMTLQAPGGPFTLTATADRIDLTKDGGIVIIDYKTGAPPHENEVVNGFSPQLPLEAVIMAAGGFNNITAAPVESLSFWHLHGRGDGGTEKSVRAAAATVAADAREGLAALVAKFDDPETAYEARPNPAFAPKYSDYEHLARVKEWAAGEDEGEA